MEVEIDVKELIKLIKKHKKIQLKGTLLIKEKGNFIIASTEKQIQENNMGTRCQIQFSFEEKHEGKTYKDGEVLIYRHSDGYPDGDSGVIETLKRFFKWNSRNSDLEYMTANYILFEKLEMIQQMNYFAKESPSEFRKEVSIDDILNPNQNQDEYWHRSYGICQPNDIHGDIAYFYNVDVTKDEKMHLATIKVRTSQKGKVLETHKIRLDK